MSGRDYRIRGLARSTGLWVLSLFVFCVFGAAADAAITLVQHAGGDAGITTSSTLAFPASNAAGNWLAVVIRAGQTGQSFTVTDTRGNTYRRALQTDLTLDTVTVGVYFAESIAEGANAVTVTDTVSGGTLRFSILEYSGVATTSSQDGAAVLAEGSGTSASSGPLTTAANGDLILGVIATADDATITAESGFTIQERVPDGWSTKLVAEDQRQSLADPIAATATIAPAQPWAAAVMAFRVAPGGPPPPPVPDLTLAKTHAGAFAQGQAGATYTLTATNGGTGPTSGSVTVTDSLPEGLTATSLSGTGWSCTLAPLSCNRVDVLTAGTSFPPITLRVDVAASAPASVTNVAAVSGGGQTNTANDSASDPTTIGRSVASQIGQWSAVQNWPIVAVHAHLLPNGDVLAWTDYTANEGAQIWHPPTNTFTPETYSAVSLFCSGHSYLADGRLLVAGGIVGLSDDVGPRESTLFDPVSESWSPGPLMSVGRDYATATTLPDGRVLVQGGTTTCTTCIADLPEIYDPVTGVWTPLSASATKAFKYYPHIYVLPDGRILAAGQDDSAVITQALDLTTQTWTPIDSRIIDGHSSVMYRPGKIMKAGKATADDQGLPAVATTYDLDMTQPSPSWQATAPMAFARSYLNLTVLPDGDVLATGGGTSTDKANFATAVHEAELWSATSKTWTTMSAAQIPRLYHSTALLLPDATVLVAGGGRQNGRSQPDPKDQANAEIFSPPYLFRGPRPVISSAPSVLEYGATFSVATPDFARIGSVSLIALGSVTHSFNQNQRFVPLPFAAVGGSLNVTAPANGNIAPPGPYMLFVVDTAGVPSAAAMVRIEPPPDDLEPPTPPTRLQASPAPAGVSLTWSASTDNVGVSGYNVHRGTASGFTPAVGNRIGQTAATSYLDAPLISGTYYYRVLAQDGRANVSGPSNEAAATIVSSGGPATIALVQHAGRDAGVTTSSTLAFPASNTAGNWLAVVIRAGRTGQSFTVTDTRGNTYRRALQSNLTLDTVTVGVYFAESIAGGANTVTVTDTVSGGTLRFSILEYSGVAATSSQDGAAVLAEGNGTSASSGPLTTTANGDLILGVISTADDATLTAGSGFTIQERVPAGSSTKLAAEDQRQSLAGPIAATATFAPARPWAAAVAAFRATVAPPSNGPKLTITAPAEGAAVPGSTVAVAYTWAGDATEVNHVHFQLDANPVVMDLSLDGAYQFSGVRTGAHTLMGWLVRSDHSTIAGSDATPVHFTVVVDPSDPTPPQVALTAPAAGSTVSGVVTVTADASDNRAVYGVQFKLDGTNLGGEDLVAPYSTDWDTSTVANGPHTLTAVGRDVAGNETTATPRSVTVANIASNDPSVIGQWAGPYNWPLVSIHATLMPDGKVLLYDDHTTSAGVQVWDPVSGSLTSRPYNANNLFCSGHTLLPDGRVIVVGGHRSAYYGIADATLFAPQTQTWSAAASMTQDRWYPTATSLPDGRVLVVSGASACPTCSDPNGTHAGIALIPEIYDPRTNTWSSLTSAPLSLPLYPHMFVLPDGRVLAAASHEDAIVSRALNVAAQTWATVDPVARNGGSSVMYRPGKILKSGMGRNPDYAPVASTAAAFVMDATLASPTWRSIAPMNFARTQHNLTVLPDGNVFAVGGSTNSDVYDTAATVKTAELWSPTTETWRTLAVMQEPRHYHSTSLLLPDGRVLVAGGGRFGPDFPSAEIYSPPYLFKGPRPVIASAPPVIQLNSVFAVGTPDAARIARVALLRLGSVTHAFDANQRYVELGFAPVTGGVSVTAPTSANIAPPGHYMLVLVDTNGVPSVGSIVRVPAPWEITSPPAAPTSLTETTPQ